MENRFARISSHEIKQWAFCPRQWYLLRTTGRRVDNAFIRKGSSFHHAKARQIRKIKIMQNILVSLVVIGAALCLFFLLS
jgi:hypothetical protein